MERGEEREQASFIKWTHTPAVRELAPALRWMFHCPNGGKRDAITGGQMRALGVKPGVPDLLMPVLSGRDSGLALEFKSATGTKAPEPDRMARSPRLEWLGRPRGTQWRGGARSRAALPRRGAAANMIRQSLAKALEASQRPLSGRECAIAANLPYKVAIDALGRMHDTGSVVRFGRKYSATWALTGTMAAAPYDAFGALEAAWHARRPPLHGGTPKASDDSLQTNWNDALVRGVGITRGNLPKLRTLRYLNSKTLTGGCNGNVHYYPSVTCLRTR